MKMKKVLMIVLVAIMVLAIGACGNKADGGGAADSSDGGSSASSGISGIDLEGEGRQTIQSERVTLEKLKEVAAWANDMGDDKFNLTYDDFKAKLGVDANEYEWSGMNGAFFWFASDEDGPYLSPVFKEGNGTLFALGGLNVG